MVGESESCKRKGNRGGIEGRLEVDLWTADDENADTKWRVMASEFPSPDCMS